MDKSINAWSVPNPVSWEKMFESVAQAGFATIELNIDRDGASAHSIPLADDPALYRQIRSLGAQFQLPVCSVSTSLYGAALGSRLVAERRRGQDLLRRQLACARELGARDILVVPGGIEPGTAPAEAYALVADTLGELLPEIEASGIRVGFENVWNSFFLTAREMADFIDQFQCPAIGAYFDVGNVAAFAYPEHWIDTLGQRIFHIHVKDFRRSHWFAGTFVNLLEGSIDWPAVARALNRIGYRGSLTAELSPLPDCPELLYHMTAEALDYIIAQA